MVPEFALLNVGKAELPVLFLLIDAFEKALSLLLLREVQEELDDAGSIAVEVSFQIDNGFRTVFALYCLLVTRHLRESLTLENFGMYADDQHLLVIGSVGSAQSQWRAPRAPGAACAGPRAGGSRAGGSRAAGPSGRGGQQLADGHERVPAVGHGADQPVELPHQGRVRLRAAVVGEHDAAGEVRRSVSSASASGFPPVTDSDHSITL